jgi:peptidoglycan/xylan/chitin deacetylase (PgdA/CDA1 family)
LLSAAKFFGGFWLADRVKPKGIPILCYHGFSITDEHRFRPALSITPERFEARLAWLLRSGYKVIALSEALHRLDSGVFGRREAVITIDDGFYTFRTIGWPLLKRYGMPATLYATTYYATHSNPVFRLAVQYFFWRTRRTQARFDDLSPEAPQGACQVQGRLGVSSMWRLIRWGEKALSENERWALAVEIARRLDVDHEELRTSRRLSLLTPEELHALARDGLDIELHTHRHHLPDDDDGITREITDNRDVLRRVTDRPLRHFCYPSGVWSNRHWPALAALGIESAVTCAPGFNAPDTPRLALRRFLDSAELTQRDFEAELTGLKTIARALLGRKNEDAFSY